MTASKLIPGSQYFADPSTGRPVANAKIYIGAPNTDPTILANRVTVTLTKQDGSTVSIPPASQPLTTTAGGLLAYSGSAVQATVSTGAYSIALHDSNDSPKDYFPSVVQPVSIAAPTLQADNFYTNDASSASNAYVIIPPVSTDALIDGQEITFRPSDNGSGSAAISVIGSSGLLGTFPWVLADGTSDLPNDYVKTTRDYKARWKASTSRFIDQDLGLFSYNPSIQFWNTHIDYFKVPSYVSGTDGQMYKSTATTGPNLGGAVDPVGDLTGKWILTGGSAPAGSVASCVGTYNNLKIVTTGMDANVVVTVDEIVLENAANQYATVRSVNKTISMTSSGANGLDTGTVAASTEYHAWIIYNGTTVAGLASLSSTAPTLPTGYTYKARVGGFFTDGTGNKYPLSYIKRGRRAQYVVVPASNVVALPTIQSGATGNINTPTWTSKAVGAFVPSTATTIGLILNDPTAGCVCIAAPNGSYDKFNSTTNPPPLTATNFPQLTNGSLILESTNIYIATQGANSLIQCVGWEENV